MRKIIFKISFSLVVFVLPLIVIASDSTKVEIKNNSEQQLWQMANEAYTGNNYKEAIKLYNSILSNNLESYKLYYNLGNAYFKEGDIAKAIVNFKRAQRMAPTNNDIQHNLAVADGMTLNRIESLPEFFLNTFYKDVRGLFSSNSWAKYSIIFFALMLSLVMFYLLSNTPFKRKIGFTGAAVALGLFLLSAVFSVQLRDDVIYSNEAVVLSSAEAVKSSPNEKGKDVFIINEGSVVEVIDSLGDWTEIVVASGNRGWIRSKALEII